MPRINIANNRHLPILLLLTANIICGLFVFRDYGFSWDEPLFYDYAESLGYAYSPAEWFSGDFNLENAYGASGTDHANRGPAYILLAREPVKLLEAIGLDLPLAWHLVNFLTFQLGVYFFYRIALRWLKPGPAIAASTLFAWQPLLWGHAFINPKDPPFLVFFLGAVLFGFEMVDALADNNKTARQKTVSVLLAGLFLGIATSIRVLGPFAGLLVIVHALGKLNRKSVSALVAYGITAFFIMIIAWPYLWINPLQRFVEVSGFMSDNPTQLKVLFGGQIYRADELPRRYLPTLLVITLTEPVWILFLIGLISGFWKSNREKLVSLSLLLAWFLIPLIYVLMLKPPMYDGFRHFLFILPPVFIFTGFGFERLFNLFDNRAITIGLTALLLLPGLLASFALHPYEYAYYNAFVKGTSGAFRSYETEYWLTCYKEAVENFQSQISKPSRIYVHREAYIAATYANENVTVLDERGALDQISSGDYVLVNSRTNEDEKTFEDAPVTLEVTRGEALFCVIRRIP